MIIPKEEVEEFIKNLLTGDFEDIHIDYGVRKGVEFAEEYVYKYTSDLVIENQGLKLYKDNEAERFKELVVAFANWLFLYRQNGMGEWKHQNRNVIIKTTEELYETFLKERNETNS